MEHLTLLHVGCANRYYEGFINTDKDYQSKHGRNYKLDLKLDISEPWPFEDESIDGVVSMHCLQQLYWRDLIKALREAYRVLKKGGVFRFGSPSIEIKDFSVDYMLGWNNTNLFSRDLLNRVFKDRIGFRSFRERGYHKSELPALTRVDNRRGRCTMFYEAIK